MDHVLARSQRLVKPDRWIVAVISLHEDGPDLAFLCDALEALNQRRRDSAASMILSDGQVVDVNLAPRLFELVQLVGHEPAHDLAAQAGDEHDDVLLAEQRFEIRPAWRLRAICRGLGKGSPEQCVEFFNDGHIRGSETKDLERLHRHVHGPNADPRNLGERRMR